MKLRQVVSINPVTAFIVGKKEGLKRFLLFSLQMNPPYLLCFCKFLCTLIAKHSI